MSPLRLPVPPLGHRGGAAPCGGAYEGREYSDSATFSLKAASISPVSRLAEIAVPEDVVLRARCGEESAQASLYAALAPATFGLIRRIVTSRALAEDLFQDTMMTVFERIGAFRGEAPLGAWVRRIAITKCLMYLRSPWHRARLVIDRDDDEEALSREELMRLVVPDTRAEQMDVERALAILSPLPLVMAIALTALEFLVAGLQAYVFTVLTCIYLNDALHPGH